MVAEAANTELIDAADIGTVPALAPVVSVVTIALLADTAPLAARRAADLAVRRG
jgi:hypothetical protein